MCTLQYRKLDFEEFAASAISVYQMEALETWEQHARRAYELFDKEGNRPIVIEELASVRLRSIHLLRQTTGSLDIASLTLVSFGLAGTGAWPVGASPRCPPGLDPARRREAELPGVHKALARGVVALDPQGLAMRHPLLIPAHPYPSRTKEMMTGG